MKRLTLQEVANKLGLNQSTVSRALQNHPRISADTRKRVQKLCTKLGYKAHSGLSELAASRWQPDKVGTGTTIAFIDCSNPSVEVHLNMVPALLRQASTLGY